jgi:hypothetical protein
MDVEQYAWATKALVRDAEDSVEELEEERRRGGTLILLFIPLAVSDPSGFYRISSETTGFVCQTDGSIEWHFSPKDPTFARFAEESRNASSTLHDYFVRLLSYALAHGMDVAKADAAGNGRSILHAFPHSDVHTDAPCDF